MYEFLCRHYQPGDRIYIFGFSRGAFTARVLAYFISVCGILDRTKEAPGKPGRRMETDRGLRRGVKQAYKSYRRRYWDKAWCFQRFLAKACRWLRNRLPGWEVLPADQFADRFSHRKPDKPDYLIEFIGVWDTVDAVGLPIAELSDLLDRWVYPYKFPDQTFSDEVARACHALAIDDERQTFHPVLWDESDSAKAARVKQVWFAGTHANVGGGYPEDNLAYVSLHWMINEVRAKSSGGPGLVLNTQKLDVIRQRAEPLGKLYDSRRGLGVYYRYKPRYIADLCNQKGKRYGGADRRSAITIKDPKIHHSVLTRIGDSKAGYAPIGLPARFSVVDSSGGLAPFVDPAFPDEKKPAAQRAKLLARTRDHVFWCRCIYFGLLILTYTVVSMPLYWPPIPGWQPVGDGVTSKASVGLAWLFERLSGMIPDFATYWTNAWTQSPRLFIACLVTGIVIFVWSYWVEGNIRELSEGGWWHLKANSSPRPIPPRGIFEAATYRARRSIVGWELNGIFFRVVLPAGFVVFILFLIISGGYRLFVYYPFVKTGICQLTKLTADAKATAPASDVGESGPLAGAQTNQPITVRFDTKDTCFDTGITLEAGKRYQVTLTGEPNWGNTLKKSRLFTNLFCASDPAKSMWQDASYPASFKGLDCVLARFLPRLMVGWPARRHIVIPWFTLIGEVGRDSDYVLPFNQPRFVFQAEESGRLYLYVNDAIDPMSCRMPETCKDKGPDCTTCEPDWDQYYRNNSGVAIITNDPTLQVNKSTPMLQIVEYQKSGY
jgi:hypothetical protein